jgi:hypothetical protein
LLLISVRYSIAGVNDVEIDSIVYKIIDYIMRADIDFQTILSSIVEIKAKHAREYKTTVAVKRVDYERKLAKLSPLFTLNASARFSPILTRLPSSR